MTSNENGLINNSKKTIFHIMSGDGLEYLTPIEKLLSVPFEPAANLYLLHVHHVAISVSWSQKTLDFSVFRGGLVETLVSR